jgi:arginine decarboxylase
MVVCPRDAFYSPQKTVSLENSIGEISGEMIMAYPPGIPVICMGERITKEIVEYIKMLKNERCQIQGTADPYVDYVKVLGSR